MSIVSSSRTWHVEKGAPMHQEAGWLRVKPGTSTLAFTIAQNTGMILSQMCLPLNLSARTHALNLSTGLNN